jgi:hypothetical protein
VLGQPDVCATPRGYFNFHAAHILETGGPAPAATELLMNTYPEHVRAWINANGGLTKEWMGVKATVFLPLCKEGI